MFTHAFGTSYDWSRKPRTVLSTGLLNGSWYAPEPLPGDTQEYSGESAIAVMPDGGSHGILAQILQIGTDGRVYHRTRDVNGLSPLGVVPAAGSTNGIKAKKVAIAGARDGSAQCLIVGEDDRVYWALRDQNTYSWIPFTKLDGYGGAADFAAKDVAIAIVEDTATSPGHAHMVASASAGSAGALYHRIRAANATWSSFQQVPNTAGPDVRETAIASAPDYHMHIVATVANGSGGFDVKHTVRWAGTGSWDSFATVGSLSGALTDVALAITPDSKARMLVTDAAGVTKFQERTNITAQSSWTSALTPTTPPALNPTTPPELVGKNRGVSMSASPFVDYTTEVLLMKAQAQ